MQLVQTCLYAGNILQHRFNRQGRAVKHVQACLCTRNDGESSFHCCGGPVKLFMCGKHPITPFSPPRWAVKHVQACLSASKGQFSPLWGSCGAGANLFISGKHPVTPF